MFTLIKENESVSSDLFADVFIDEYTTIWFAIELGRFVHLVATENLTTFIGNISNEKKRSESSLRIWSSRSDYFKWFNREVATN